MKRVTITIAPDVHEKGKALARAERRDFSSYVEWLLKQENKREKEAEMLAVAVRQKEEAA
jgi:predicted CopG family antitoxin